MADRLTLAGLGECQEPLLRVFPCTHVRTMARTVGLGWDGRASITSIQVFSVHAHANHGTNGWPWVGMGERE